MFIAKHVILSEVEESEPRPLPVLIALSLSKRPFEAGLSNRPALPYPSPTLRQAQGAARLLRLPLKGGVIGSLNGFPRAGYRQTVFRNL